MAAPPLILVADGNEPVRCARARIIRAFGYSTIEASTGAEALRIVSEHNPEAILLDVELADCSGIEICRRIKAKHETVLVVQTSAFTASADSAAEIDCGADAYLTQPEPRELASMLRALLRLRRAEMGLRRLNEAIEQRVAARTCQLAEANEQLVTEMKRREEIETERRRAQKMEALGQLSGSVAHDFNNLLTVVRGNLEMIEGSADPARIERYARAAQRAVARGELLTQQLLVFSRRHPLRPETVDLTAVLRRISGVLRHAAGDSVELVLDMSSAPCRVHLDVSQFEAAVLNLVFNARDAMPNGGRVTLRTEVIEAVPSDVPDVSAPANGEYCRLSVIDNGTGMTRDVADRVFEPFFTTKEAGNGTGLGLAQVYGFVKQSSGFVSLATKPGQGTTVSLLLPQSRDQLC